MTKHHEESIAKLMEYYEKQPGVIAVVLGGSLAKKCERPDSDVDAAIVVTDDRFAELEKEGRLSECIHGECTYAGGYFDVKYMTKDFLRAVADKGSEPSRNAFRCARCLRTSDPEVTRIVERIPVFQKAEKQEKLLSFYSALQLNLGYLWSMSPDNPYLRARAVADIVLFGLRILLEDREILFPCHKALLETVEGIEDLPTDILPLCRKFLAAPDDTAKTAFIESVMAAVSFQPPKDHAAILTRFVDDNEQWWFKGRPVIAEW